MNPAKALAKSVLPTSVWFWLRDIVHGDVPAVLVPLDELERVFRRALTYLRESSDQSVGDYLEFGVFRGDSLLCMDRLRRELGLSFRLFGFDSFEGLPALAAGDESLGWYEKILTPALVRKYDLAKVSLIMIDCDLYSSTQTALEFSAPLIEDEAIVFFDDWDGGTGLAERGEGEARAYFEFLDRHPEFSSEEFDTYYHTEMDPPPESKVFRIRRVAELEERPVVQATSTAQSP
jgi:hypothetical protein